MASVRMTEVLRSKIERSALGAFDLANPMITTPTTTADAVKKAIENMPQQQYAKRIHKLYKEEFAHLEGKFIVSDEVRRTSVISGYYETLFLESYNKPIFKELGSVVFHWPHPATSSPRRGRSVTITFNTPLEIAVASARASQFYGSQLDMVIEQLRVEDQTKIKELITALSDQRRAQKDKRTEYGRQIHNLVQTVNTVKQLLDAWPAAESLLPSETISKMHVKQTRAEKAKQIKEEIKFDSTIANQTILTARILGAANGS